MKKKERKKELKKLYKNEIPDNIKVIFGKFYFFSLLYLIFFLIIYPFVLIERFSLLNLLILLIFLSLFYIWIIIDVIKKKKGYNSNLFFLLIGLVILAISLSVVKLIIFLEI